MPRDIKELQRAEIKVGKYRSRQGPLVVEELSESIREQGLLEPIGVLKLMLATTLMKRAASKVSKQLLPLLSPKP